MDELSECDREAVVLRFFARRPFAEIGRTLDLTEDAARMRVERAIMISQRQPVGGDDFSANLSATFRTHPADYGHDFALVDGVKVTAVIIKRVERSNPSTPLSVIS